MSSQKTRHQNLNSYWVMNSLGDNLSTQQRYPPQSLKYKGMYACIMNIYVPHEVKYQRALAKRTSQMNLMLKYDNNHRLEVKLYDKRDDFIFAIVNLSFEGSNIPQSPTYGFCVSQLIRYSRAFSLYEDFQLRIRLLTSQFFFEKGHYLFVFLFV